MWHLLSLSVAACRADRPVHRVAWICLDAGAVGENSRVQQQGQLLHRPPPARESSLSLAELACAPQAAADSPAAAAPSQQHQHGSLARHQQGQVTGAGRSAASGSTALQEPGHWGSQETASWAASPPTGCAASLAPTPRSPLSSLHTYDQQGSPSIEDMLAGALPAVAHCPSATCMLVAGRAHYAWM